MNGNYYGDGNQPPQNNGYPPQDNGYMPQNNGYQQPNNQFQPPINNYYQSPLNNGFNPMGPEDPGKGLAIGSLVCGIVGIGLAWCFGIGAIVGIVAIILGVISGNKSSAQGFPRNGMAIAGLICGIFATILGAICAVYVVSICFIAMDVNSGIYQYY